jgi:hypothetical protein
VSDVESSAALRLIRGVALPVVVVGLVVLAVAVRPVLVWWVALGACAGLAASWGSLGSSGARTRVAFSGLVLAIGVALALAGCGGSSSMAPAQGVELDGTLTASASYDRESQSLNIAEQYDLGNATLANAIHSPLLPLDESIQALASQVMRQARREGWQTAVNSDGVSLTESFSSHLTEHQWLPGVTDNTLNLRLPGGFRVRGTQLSPSEQNLLPPVNALYGLPVSFRNTGGSTLTLLAPDRTILATQPASSGTSTTRGREQRTLGLRPGETTIGYEVISRAFRVEPLTMLATATFWWPAKWLLALLIGAVNDDVRQWLGRRLRRSKSPSSKSAPADSGG